MLGSHTFHFFLFFANQERWSSKFHCQRCSRDCSRCGRRLYWHPSWGCSYQNDSWWKAASRLSPFFLTAKLVDEFFLITFLFYSVRFLSNIQDHFYSFFYFFYSLQRKDVITNMFSMPCYELRERKVPWLCGEVQYRLWEEQWLLTRHNWLLIRRLNEYC